MWIALKVAAASALIGAAVGVMESTWSGVLEDMLYAECIGLSVYVVHEVLSRRGPRATFGQHLRRAALSIPIGFVAGIELTAALRGRPLGWAAFAQIAPFAAVVTLVSGAGFIYFFWSRRRIAEEAAARADALRTAAESRLKMLQTQIEPHMLFNTLANLRTLIDVDPSRAQTMIDELIVYLRATLSASRTATTTMAAEFGQLRAYLELMTVRMAHRLRYELDLPPDLATASIPPMLLQPIVENAIRHGLEPKIEGGRIRVTATLRAGRVAVEVVDDGVGLDADHDAGYGLAHVRERLATLYGDDGTMTMAPAAGGGVRVDVVWPLKPSGVRP